MFDCTFNNKDTQINGTSKMVLYSSFVI